MYAYLYRKLSQHRGSPRFWLEGKQAARGGFEPGVRYSVTINPAQKMVVLSVVDTGQRLVSGKEKGGERIPVIDINSREVLGILDGYDVVRVIVRQRRIFILPSVAEIKRRERLERLAKKMESGDPIALGSMAHGIGVLAHALHAGLRDGGVPAKMMFANDIREELLEQSFNHNRVWDDQTMLLSAPMQELALDRWAMDQIPQLDILEGGLACSGASGPGRAKRGTECAEAHPEVGALVVPFLQFVQASNAAMVVLENVPAYQSSASMWILRNALRDMGYEVHETLLDAAEFNELERRRRMCMIAVTRGIQFNFEELEKPAPKARRLGDVLDEVPEDDPCWSGYDYLKRHQEKHAVRQAGRGSGFAMQLFEEDSTFIGTITKGYSKVRSTDPKIAHPKNPELMRQVTPEEHARCKGIPERLTKGLSKTIAHEGLGQSVCYGPFRAIGQLLARTLKKPIDSAGKAVMPDPRAAA